MEQDDFSLCMLNNVRRAARAVSRRYERLVRHFGLKAAQFSVLVLVRENPGRNAGQLAERFSIDRTTLVRNLALLEKNGLIKGDASQAERGRAFELTKDGRELLEAAIPVWRKAQADLEAELGTDEFHQTISALQRLSKV